mmetsp:Transcript_46354/g.68421  ORF Transcript_46354/g.68421 Transcript_46354/m.68421 type:complete len:310 (-) Transcript_46354:152-1081(-)|eukprot:CAMPEP_0195509658 /NCGR_PEP_ID=MMETSP0794_2-20130614/2532_1 /TAXON_ID=515487 /ORGANISM="Stephanopyxis turris, Strain CCMP 815" /LENGTH=309 /DNA_ID=CAMNT_0040636935 /DNA_START=80 /DNA_END=1009 /DNA_ORIENTATION=+
MRIIRQPIVAGLLVISSWTMITSGFVFVAPPLGGEKMTTTRMASRLSPFQEGNDAGQNIISNKCDDADDDGIERTGLSNHNNNPMFRSARNARILSPLGLMTSASSILWTTNPLPANAGVGAVVPFEATRKEKFSGSIGNSVVILRLNSSLRKRGYFAKKAVVATSKSKDDLGFLLSREFGDRPLYDLEDGSSSLEAYVKNCNEDKLKALILYGQDVDISPDGEVGDLKGKDLKSSEQFLIDKMSGVSNEATLVGGVIIHRDKTGASKDRGEDCFLPTSIVNVKNGVVTDLFDEVFGDLPTPRQTRILR